MAFKGDRNTLEQGPKKPVRASFCTPASHHLLKGPSCPLSSLEEKRRLRWLGSDQPHRRLRGRGKYAALIFNAFFPFSPNKPSAMAGRADLFCQQWKYFKYDACHWVTRSPSHKNTHCRSIQERNLLDLISKPLGLGLSCKQRRISVPAGLGQAVGWARERGSAPQSPETNIVCILPAAPQPWPLSLALPIANSLSEGLWGRQSSSCLLAEQEKAGRPGG